MRLALRDGGSALVQRWSNAGTNAGQRGRVFVHEPSVEHALNRAADWASEPANARGT